jgi:hypothetical protein
MLSQCANPGCTNRFRFLHDGKLFVLDCGSKPDSGAGDEGWTGTRQIERFWLCAICARTLTLRFDGTRVVRLPLSGSTGSLGYPSQKVA